MPVRLSLLCDPPISVFALTMRVPCWRASSILCRACGRGALMLHYPSVCILSCLANVTRPAAQREAPTKGRACDD